MYLLALRKYLPRYWHRSQQDSPAPGFGLATLPTEIILHILSFLPISSAACLAFCNHPFKARLGLMYWDSIRLGHNERERDDFLSLVAQDHPSYIFCYQCSRLHHVDEIGSPGPVNKPSTLLPCCEGYLSIRPDGHVSRRTTFKLSFAHVQLAMKRYRRGSDHGISLDDLSFTEVQNSFQEDRDYTTFLTADARILASDHESSLLMRFQQLLLIPVDPFESNLDQISRIPFGCLCPHIYRYNSAVYSRLRCRLKHISEDECKHTTRCMDTYRCQSCSTEYTTDVLDSRHVDGGIIVAVTTWMNLGTGRTPLGSNWWNHLNHYPERLGKRIEIDKILRGMPLNSSIRSSFEGEDGGTSHHRFTRENTTKLLELRRFQQSGSKKQLKHNDCTWRKYRFDTWILAPRKWPPLRADSRPVTFLLLKN